MHLGMCCGVVLCLIVGCSLSPQQLMVSTDQVAHLFLLHCCYLGKLHNNLLSECCHPCGVQEAGGGGGATPSGS